MPPRADRAALNVQPRQRRAVYEDLAAMDGGSSVADLLRRLDIPESELRETLRKLSSAGLAERLRGTWRAVPLETAEPRSDSAPEADDHGSSSAGD